MKAKMSASADATSYEVVQADRLQPGWYRWAFRVAGRQVSGLTYGERRARQQMRRNIRRVLDRERRFGSWPSSRPPRGR